MKKAKDYLDLGKPEDEYHNSVIEGQKIYSDSFLRIYDIVVLHIISRWFWRCPPDNMVRLYNENLRGNHLDIGVGTGYLLQKAKFPVSKPRISVLDLNPNTLVEARRRLSAISEDFSAYRANILEPIAIKEKFDSIGLSFLFHCVPGQIYEKATVAFKNLIKIRSKDGVIFGSTALYDLGQEHPLSRYGMKNLNKRGVFHNTQDTLPGLEKALAENFKDYKLYTVGAVAFFVAGKARR
ncbi:methyltransferase domain protein [Leptospira fainei serovar Hurstbridge str. BUT 6]|uniref:Methyltransferase domain protein n=1 Tax=Leptospira fainei serovar Hurstbridge str. BUT 6 TaxID=1193011 RepID=S3V9Z4_9LEPT|nr:class I SAM-dependent methyltransferase [Leptospira fainei]EPG73265.1 methyltransferase domain protein [Leptospira fainei serovar Hurstbridge str. BUT 6]